VFFESGKEFSNVLCTLLTFCVTMASIYLVCFVFVDLSRASCDCLSLSLWKVSVSSGLSRDNSFWREWIASQWC